MLAHLAAYERSLHNMASLNLKLLLRDSVLGHKESISSCGKVKFSIQFYSILYAFKGQKLTKPCFEKKAIFNQKYDFITVVSPIRFPYTYASSHRHIDYSFWGGGGGGGVVWGGVKQGRI